MLAAFNSLRSIKIVDTAHFLCKNRINYAILPPALRKVNNNPMISIINFTDKSKHSASLQTSRNDYTRELYFFNINQFIFL